MKNFTFEKQWDIEKKKKCRQVTKNLINTGKIKKKDKCQICKSTEKIHCHHVDYTVPTDVRWLCYKCHAKAHSKKSKLNPVNRKEKGDINELFYWENWRLIN